MAHSQKEELSAGVCRRPSVDGTESGQVQQFHPYLPLFSDRTRVHVTVPQCAPPPPARCGPDLRSPHSNSWGSNNQGFYPETPAVSPETSCFVSRDCPSLHLEVSSKPYATANQCNGPKYSFQKFSSTCQESPSQFPKPIYSYSILIFMALKNSKTGSLPVSEIYSFMTEHFPYFKTAPDGWKNSVRHNLSLNKCFEKVENKNGNTSRKGCLWALNPAKVDKMQEELHKWRRKDPGTVRRSMAKPEDLDHLLGEKPNKFKTLSTCNTMSARAHMYTTASCYSSEHPRPPCSYSQHYPKSQYHSHSTPNPDLSYPLCPPYSQHMLPPRCLKIPPAYSEIPHDGHSGRSMYELLLDGDTGCDIDTLNPSLTDLQLQGSLWEELKEDSARVVPSLSPSTVETVTEQNSYLQPTVPPTSEDMTILNKAHYVDKDSERLWGQAQNYPNGHPLGVYSGKDSFAGTLTSCATLM